MKILNKIKDNKGSTLTLVLFMLFMLSVTAIAVISLTGSELSMSVLGTDQSKALMAAQAGAEKAAQFLDEQVAQAQEDARVISSKKVQDSVNGFTAYSEDSITGVKTPVQITAPFIGVINNYSNPGEIIIINEEKLNEIYEKEYKYQFYTIMNDWFSKQTTLELNSDAPWHPTKMYYMNETNSNDGTFAYSGFNPTTIGVTSDFSIENKQVISSIALTSVGEYTSPTTGSTYKRSISAEFSLLTEPNGTSSEIPIAYKKMTKERINKLENIPEILSGGKALVAEKNIISVDGTVTVTGNVINYGTLPTNINSDNGYEYGGIMAGMTCGLSTSDAPNTWGSLEVNMIKTLGIGSGYILDDNYFKRDHAGSFKINGSVGTMSYLHSLYSIADDSSLIEVTGNTFARNVSIDSESNSSVANFNNLYTIDDLDIYGNNSTVNIGYSKEGLLVGLSRGTETNPLSSAVAVAGDSNLSINGSVYVGGSTLYSNYEKIVNNKKQYYISGMSIQKSDSRPAEAFEYNGLDSSTMDHFAGDVFYLYTNDNADPYSIQKTLTREIYEKDSSDPDDTNKKVEIEMMEGSSVRSIFSLTDKAMHLREIWNKFWKNDIGYSSYFNTGDITISTNSEGKLKGFCYGGVTANGTFYGPYEDFGRDEGSYAKATNGGTKYYDDFGGDEDSYAKAANDGTKYYEEFMSLFLNSGDLAKYTKNSNTYTANLSNNIEEGYIDSGDIFTPDPSGVTPPNELIKTNNNEFMYFSKESVVLNNNMVDGKDLTETITNGFLNGIIYSKGDIYVQAGTKIKGILIAEGNIVFLGDATVIHDDDEVDNMINNLLYEEKVGILFKHRLKDVVMNDKNAIVQTVRKKSVKNIKILSWKEV